MMDTSDRVLRGPLALVGWAVAVAWLAVGAVAWVRFGEPWAWVFAAVSAGASIATALVSHGLRVRMGADGVSPHGGGEVRWADIDHVGVRRGWLSVPYLAVRVGRALDEVPLDGIATFGRAGALRLAGEVADAGQLGEVVLPEPRAAGRGRRGIRG